MFLRKYSRTKTTATIATFCVGIILLSSCESTSFIDKNNISVMIESGEGFSVLEPILTQERGTDFRFKISLEHDTLISSVSYESYKISEEGEYTILVLEKVMYPTVVNIETSSDYVVYDGNGGTFENGTSYLEEVRNENHIRFNTLSGAKQLTKEGYLLTGWTDDDNNLIGLGSRASRSIKRLKASWVKESSKNNFEFVKEDDHYVIQKYIGSEEEVALPSYHNGIKVTGIKTNAFVNKDIKKVYFNAFIKNVSDSSFVNCNIQEITFFDSLMNIKDSSFINCILDKVHINAVQEPCYSGTFYDSFNDKMDYLELIKNKKKIVLFSGSSTRYGYNSPLLKTHFSDYEVINMGVYAYFSAKIQLDIISNYLNAGDVIIDAPEFDAPSFQMFEDVNFEHRIFNMFEANYDNLKYLNVSQYHNFFNSYYKYQIERTKLPKLNYDTTVFHLDDDGKYYSEDIYNINGDFILERDGEVKEGIIVQQPLAYVVGQISDKQFETYNNVYEDFKNRGIHFFFNYAPRNIDSLTKESTPTNREMFEKQIIKNIKAPFLSKMNDFLYPADHFYLIDNHLTSAAADKRTNLTAINLKKYIK